MIEALDFTKMMHFSRLLTAVKPVLLDIHTIWNSNSLWVKSHVALCIKDTSLLFNESLLSQNLYVHLQIDTFINIYILLTVIPTKLIFDMYWYILSSITELSYVKFSI